MCQKSLYFSVHSLIKRLLALHLIKFLIVGGMATGLQFALLILFVEIFHLPAVAASASAYGSSAVFNYLLNYYFTFNSNKSHTEAFSQFVIVVAIGLCINTISFTLFSKVLHYFVAQIFATLITLISNFLLHKYWIFKHKS